MMTPGNGQRENKCEGRTSVDLYVCVTDNLSTLTSVLHKAMQKGNSCSVDFANIKCIHLKIHIIIIVIILYIFLIIFLSTC